MCKYRCVGVCTCRCVAVCKCHCDECVSVRLSVFINEDFTIVIIIIIRDESGVQRKTRKPSRDYADGEFPRKRGSSPIDLALLGNRGVKAGSQVKFSCCA